VGGVLGGVSAVPLVVKGVVAKPVAGIADALDESATAIKSAPESLMGKSAVNWDDSAPAPHDDGNVASKPQPGGLREGVKVGWKILNKEVSRGIQGLYLEPVKGAKEDGYPGLISGGGRGVVNALAAPVAGSLFFGAAVARGSANWAENPKMPYWSEMWGRVRRRAEDATQNQESDRGEEGG
jgi:hypothetical protein